MLICLWKLILMVVGLAPCINNFENVI